MQKRLRWAFELAYERHIIGHSLQARTTNCTGVNDLYSSVPTPGLWVSEWIPLAGNRVALYKGYDETDNSQNVQSNAEYHDRDPERARWSEKADD